MYYFAVYF